MYNGELKRKILRAIAIAPKECLITAKHTKIYLAQECGISTSLQYLFKLSDDGYLCRFWVITDKAKEELLKELKNDNPSIRD